MEVDDIISTDGSAESGLSLADFSFACKCLIKSARLAFDSSKKQINKQIFA